MKIVIKFGRNLRELGKKISNDSRKIMETLLGKIVVVWNWSWNYEKNLESFSEIISVKLGKNYEEIWSRAHTCEPNVSFFPHFFNAIWRKDGFKFNKNWYF